jgi:hypothetical protein
VVMVVDLNGISPFEVTQKSKWLRMPDRRKRYMLCNHLLGPAGRRIQDPTHDTISVAVGLITIVYHKYPNLENRGPLDIYDDIRAKRL